MRAVAVPERLPCRPGSRSTFQIDQLLSVLVADRLDRRGGVERVARPHLVGEPHAELLQPAGTDVVTSASYWSGPWSACRARTPTDNPRPASCRPHRSAADCSRPRRPRTGRSGCVKILDHAFAVRVADLQRGGFQCHGRFSSALVDGTFGGDADAARGDHEFAALIAELGDTLAERQFAGAFALAFPGFAGLLFRRSARRRGEIGRWYS